MENRRPGEKSRKRLRRAGLILALCILTMLVAYAWFAVNTDVNASLQVGNLQIDVFVYELRAGGNDPQILADGFNADGGFDFDPDDSVFQDLHKDPSPVVYEENWEPGDGKVKLVKVANNGTLGARIKLFFNSLDVGHLDEALVYDFIPVELNAAGVPETVRVPNVRKIATLDSDVAAMPAMRLNSGEYRYYLLFYSFPTGSGNFYQEGVFAADINIVATQDLDDAERDIIGS